MYVKQGFPKMSDRIDLDFDEWLTIFKFVPLDAERAEIQFTYFNVEKSKRRRDKRIARKLENVVPNLWKFQYMNHVIYFEMA